MIIYLNYFRACVVKLEVIENTERHQANGHHQLLDLISCSNVGHDACVMSSDACELPVISGPDVAILLNSDLFYVDSQDVGAANYWSAVACCNVIDSNALCSSLTDATSISASAVGVAQTHDSLLTLSSPQITVDSSAIIDRTLASDVSPSVVGMIQSDTAKKQQRGKVNRQKPERGNAKTRKLTEEQSRPSEKILGCSHVLTRSTSKQCYQHISLPEMQMKNSKQKKRTVTNQPAVSAINIPSDSEDSALSDSDDDDECSVLNKKAKRQMDSRRILLSEVQSAQSKSKRYAWEYGSLVADEDSTQFSGTSILPEDILELQSPLQFFRYFFTNEIISYIAEQTSIYCAQQRPEKPVAFDSKEVETFLGVCMYMSLIKMSSCKNYWSNQFRVEQVAGIMTSKAFLTLKRYLHFCDNSSSDEDKLRKIRPIIDMLKHRFLEVPLEENLSIDEQMVPFKGRSSLKQYLPKKPHKWGYKVFVLSGNSGFAYDLEVYTGRQDNVLLDGEKDCGASGNVVIRLSRSVPNNVGHKLFFDNYFCSPELQVSLAHRGIHCLGTVRSNRLPNCALMSDTELKKKGRGAHAEKIAKVDDVTLSAVRWFDNRAVTFLSTFAGAQPVGETRRFSRVTHSQQQVACPHVVRVYNAHMGGVDLLDSLIGLYRTHLRSKKWYHKIFYHMMDMVVVNSWLLYRRCATATGGATKLMSLHDFKACVAEGLCTGGKEVSAQKSRKRGRPCTEETTAAKRTAAERQPVDDVRFDAIGHWPKWTSDRQRCKITLCKGISRVACSKCGVHLCCNPKKNCFHKYHVK